LVTQIEGPARGPAPVASGASAEGGCDPAALRTGGLGPAAFQRAVLTALAASPGLELAALGPFRIRAGVGGQAFEVRLDEAFRRYRHGQLEVAGAAEEVKAALGVPGAALAAAGPFPRLARRAALDPALAHSACPFDPELAVFYVRTLPSGHVPLRAGAVDDLAALHAAAEANLRAHTETLPIDADGDGPARILRSQAGDGLDAARLLLDDLVTALAGWVEGSLYLAVPCRDLLLAVGDADPAVLAAARAEAAERFEQDPWPLSPRWYRRRDDGTLVPV
jgi:hypothetical protein